MLFSHILPSLLAAGAFGPSIADASAIEATYRARAAPGTADLNSIKALRRAVSEAAIIKRDTVLKNTTTVSKAWTDATLYQDQVVEAGSSNESAQASATISCKNCYINGSLTAEVSFAGNYNASQVLQNVTQTVETDAKNITDQAITIFDAVFDEIGQAAKNAVSGDFSFDQLQYPTLPLDFDLDIPEIPGISLQFTFDDLEMYMELETSLSAGATYQLNLYTSESEVGIAISDEVLLGVVAVVDLIIDAQSEVDISSGFHLKMDDGLSLDLEMFSKNVSNIHFPGGQFEFLPVTVTTDGAILKATLRVGVHAGLSFNTPSVEVLGKAVSIGAGIEASAFANIANFVTNVTLPQLSNGGNKLCELDVVEYYEFAVGAAAGATVHVADKSWGPTPETTTVIFFTTLVDACATKTTASTTSAAPTVTKKARQVAASTPSLTTTTITTTDVFVGQVCSISGLINCPVSLQKTTTFPTVRTLVTAVPSGVTPSFPATTFNSVSSTQNFGDQVRNLISSTGAPTSFTPSNTSTGFIPQATKAIGDAGNDLRSFLDGSTNGVSNKVIFGVSVGLGIPVLIALIASLVMLCRRRKAAAAGAASAPPSTYVVGPPGGAYTQGNMAGPELQKTSNISVSVISR